MSKEMGKLLSEAQAEVDKYVWVCRYYAENFLADKSIQTDAQQSLIRTGRLLFQDIVQSGRLLELLWIYVFLMKIKTESRILLIRWCI